MYETEANREVEMIRQIPAEVIREFRDFREKIVSRTLIPWGEHCTECVWPTCYTTCDLYAARRDGRCRRFTEGMVRVPCPEALNSYLLKISFKRWAKLWSAANLKLYSVKAADGAERRDLRMAEYIHLLPVTALRNTIAQKRYSLKKRKAM